MELVNMDRNLPVSGIEYSPDSYYRMIGPGGWTDLLHSGVIRPRQDTHKHTDAFFSKGTALNRYRNRRELFDFIAEVRDPDAVKLSPNGYPVAARLIRLAEVIVYRIDNATGRVAIIHSPLDKEN